MKSSGKKEQQLNSTLAAGARPARTAHSSTGGRIVVLGGGITGLTAAWELSKHSASSILVIEKGASAGGLAGSIRQRDRVFDFGSHRIHEQYVPEVFAVIKELLGDELLKRPRRGQIRIRGKFLDYPPSPIQILTGFGLATGIHFFRDFLISRPYSLLNLSLIHI